MVKHHRRKLDAKRRQEWTGESYQAAVKAVSGAPGQSDPSSFKDSYDVPFRVALSVARRAAMAGEIWKVDDFVKNRLGDAFGRGIEVAAVLLLHGDEFDRAHDRRLPSLVRRTLRSEKDAGIPVWERKANRMTVLMYDELPPGLIEELYVYEFTPESDYEPLDRRLSALLEYLTIEERATLLAFAMPGVRTWSDAALASGVTDSNHSGYRVRRKIRRLLTAPDLLSPKEWETAA